MTINIDHVKTLRDPNTLEYNANELCCRIATLTRNIMTFWSSANGWAPIDAANLLSRSMLEWQMSLAQSLTRWPSTDSTGDLILAWVNLGALVEGQLKLFLCVFYDDYKRDVDGIFRKMERIDPDTAALEELRQFFENRIWGAVRELKDWSKYVQFVQQRRNATHAFRQRDIGSLEEWVDALRVHLSFVRYQGVFSLPYPDDDYPSEVR